MNPERVAALVARWVRFYTRDLPPSIAERRIGEIDADLHDHIAQERADGTSDRRIALSVVSRMLRGLVADAVWRGRHTGAGELGPTGAEHPVVTRRGTYRLAVGVAVGAAVILLWGMGAVGVIGVEGDRADLMYFGVLGVGLVGSVVARFRPPGMARALFATAAAQALVAVIALAAGKHQEPATSVVELLGLNGFFAGLFVGSAWLFRRAATAAHPD